MEKGMDKIKPIYEAVISLINDGVAVPDIKVSDISKRAGIGKGTIYEYFSTKEEVIVQAMLYFVRITLEHLDMFLEEKYTFREKFEGVIDWLDSQCITEPVMISLFKLTHNSSDMMHSMKQEMMESIDKWELTDHLISSMICTLRRDAEVADSVDDFKLYFIICSQLGAYMMSSKCSSRLMRQNEHSLRELAYENIIKMVS